MTMVTVSLTLTVEERDCLLRSARKTQQELEAELYRLSEIAKKGEHIDGLANTRDIAAIEFGCISSATRKLWRSTGQG